MFGGLRAKVLNYFAERPSQGIPKYRKCCECGGLAEFGERWRTGVSMPNTPTKTICDNCFEGEASEQ